MNINSTLNLEDIELLHSKASNIYYNYVDLSWFNDVDENKNFLNYMNEIFEDETLDNYSLTNIQQLYRKPNAKDSIRIIQEQENKGNGTLLITVNDKDVNKKVGYMVLGIDLIKSTVEIAMIYVSSSYRNKNIGKNLTNIAIEIAKNMEAKQVELETLESYTHVADLYKKFGFQRIGEIFDPNTELEPFVLYNLKL